MNVETVKEEKQLPGVPFSREFAFPKMPRNSVYYVNDVMGLELIGPPDHNGDYSVDQIMWWHRAEFPMDKDLKQGDPCGTSLFGFDILDFRGDYVNSFKDIKQLHGAKITPSTVCVTCGFHIYITIGFQNCTFNEGWVKNP